MSGVTFISELGYMLFNLKFMSFKNNSLSGVKLYIFLIYSDKCDVRGISYVLSR